ncbi:MAG TPA: PSD1 and planctomycete cytochrome C domain-containing protein [Planctomycetota bacterium]|nr:PSD1 and planctomycete cytochrome C domain-containing protein [Planctomycetota bacterium]
MKPAAALVAAVLFGGSAVPQEEAFDREGVEFFEKKIRPVFVEKCFSCHSARQGKRKGGLSLDTRAEILRGGDRGPAVRPGDPEASPLIQAIRYADEDFQMPPRGRLPASVVADFEAWVRRGAPDPRSGTVEAGPAAAAPRKDLWSLGPLRAGSPPEVRRADWVRTPVDRFVLARLEEAGLAPNGPADRRRWIRRLSFGLLGLPPSPEEVERFVHDPAPDALERLVDRLLASPHYGERWGRFWLDAARFAESHGFEQDYDREHAWPYRDFVIRAFNEDLPFDRFVAWQIAGDELAPDNPWAWAATGFLGAGAFPTQLTEAEFESARYDELDNMVSTLGSAMLGLSIGCARCHDHKYDPIPTAEYYRLAAIFTRTIRSHVELDLGLEAPPGAAARPGPRPVLVTTEGLKPLKHHADERGFPHFYPETYVLARGDVQRKQGVAVPGFLGVLSRAPEGEGRWLRPPPPGARTPHRRAGLARWITDVEHGAGALLARVIVNRLWHHHFGRGLVATPNDFGAQGEPPSHPELLEWLAAELVRGGWRLKPIQKLLVTSAVYLQSSDADPARDRADPANRLLGRREVRRLEAEAIRDALLATAGLLDRRMYGPGTLDEGMTRRSVYFFVKRSRLIPMMQVFDAPEPLLSAGSRPTTTVAPQALLFLNSPHVRRWAAAFGARLAEEATPEAVAERGYRLALARAPTPAERAAAAEFLRAQEDSYRREGVPAAGAAARARTDFAHALFCLNEFVYVD